jgi:glycosyltransferase involved in cell wall biosynthesis
MTSVIVPIFESQETLLRTLQSIDNLDQSVKSTIEIVLVFDGNNEECMSIVNTWKKSTECKNIILFQVHLGVAAARNLGVKASSHDIITFLDADDELLPARFSASVVSSDHKIVIGKQDMVVQGNSHIQKPELITVTSPSAFHILTMVLSRETFNFIGGFDTSYSHGSDWDFIIRARELHCTIDYSEVVFIRRYVHDSNHSLDARKVRMQHLEAVRRHLKRREN